MESTTDLNLNQQPPRIAFQQHRPIVSNRIYLSHPETYKNPYQDPRLVFRKLTPPKCDDVTPRNHDLKITASPNIMDSSTQTSKTIMELAQFDAELSPDSLTDSPRNPHPSRAEMEQIESTQTDLEIQQPNYMRRNNLINYMDGGEQSRFIPAEVDVYPKKSLTKTFLDKKHLDEPIETRSRFLQQTSPLRNLKTKKNYDSFKSQSYVESYDPNYVLDDVYPEKLSVSRFTVKNVRQIPGSGPPTFIWPPNEIGVKVEKLFENSDNDSDSGPITHKGSRIRTTGAFMAPTLSSELKNQQHTVHELQTMISPTRRGKSLSPVRNLTPATTLVKRFHHEKIPYIDQSSSSQVNVHEPVGHKIRMSLKDRNRNKMQSGMVSQLPTRPKFDEDLLKIDLQSLEIKTSENHCSLVLSHTTLLPGNLKLGLELQQVNNQGSLLEELRFLPKTCDVKNCIKNAIPPRLFADNFLPTVIVAAAVKVFKETMGDSLHPTCSTSTTYDNIVSITIARIRNLDWATALKGLAEMTELCRMMDPELIYPHMTAVNQRLLELLRSSRSHVCRTACQAAGHFFESMKDTRRPEFDDIVENLLCRTADANKFIRKDANLSLDCMVTHIPIFHSVRSLCLKGPIHKNALVRTATVRLLVCAVVIAGPDIVLNLQCHEHTRKRIITYMAKFIQDKHQEPRKYGERLYKVLCKEPMFEPCLKKFLEKIEITMMKSALRHRK